MTNVVAKFFALSRSDKKVFLSALVLLPLFRIGLRAFSFARIKKWAERPAVSTASESRATLESIAAWGRLVNIAAFYGPASATCLARSLVLHWMCRREGIDSHLHIGVRFLETKFDAHAWVEYEGHPVNDAEDVASRYHPFTDLPRSHV